MSVDRNDLAYWFPILSSIPGVLVPRTEIVTTDVDLTMLLDGDDPDGYEAFLDDLMSAAIRVGAPESPFFLRSGHTSAKHSWRRTCFVEDAEDLVGHVTAIVGFSETADIVGLPTRTWAVREFLQLEHDFTAFDGMPVAREFRCFFRDGEHICTHPYWPIDSIWSASRMDYASILEVTNRLSVFERVALDHIVSLVAPAFDGAWSLDLAHGCDGRFQAIDMAEMDRSFHWPGCPNGDH